MELEIFDSSNVRSTRTYSPAIHINKFGVFSFNPQAVELLTLTKGATISFVRDKDNPRDWFILRDPNGMVLRTNTKGNLIVNAKFVREKMFTSLNSKLGSGSMKFRIAIEPVQYKDKMMYPIITSKPL